MSPRWGNALYEHSHLRAAGKRDDWKALVEAAAAKFGEAGEQLCCAVLCCAVLCCAVLLGCRLRGADPPGPKMWVRRSGLQGCGALHTHICTPTAASVATSAPASLPPPPGAHPVDIRNALKGHPLADQLEELIGPEPEPEVGGAGRGGAGQGGPGRGGAAVPE